MGLLSSMRGLKLRFGSSATAMSRMIADFKRILFCFPPYINTTRCVYCQLITTMNGRGEPKSNLSSFRLHKTQVLDAERIGKRLQVITIRNLENPELETHRKLEKSHQSSLGTLKSDQRVLHSQSLTYLLGRTNYGQNATSLNYSVGPEREATPPIVALPERLETEKFKQEILQINKSLALVSKISNQGTIRRTFGKLSNKASSGDRDPDYRRQGSHKTFVINQRQMGIQSPSEVRTIKNSSSLLTRSNAAPLIEGSYEGLGKTRPKLLGTSMYDIMRKKYIDKVCMKPEQRTVGPLKLDSVKPSFENLKTTAASHRSLIKENFLPNNRDLFMKVNIDTDVPNATFNSAKEIGSLPMPLDPKPSPENRSLDQSATYPRANPLPSDKDDLNNIRIQSMKNTASSIMKAIEGFDITKVTDAFAESEKIDRDQVPHFRKLQPELCHKLQDWGFFADQVPNAPKSKINYRVQILRSIRRYGDKLVRLGLTPREAMVNNAFCKAPFEKKGIRALLEAVKEGDFKKCSMILEKNKYLLYGFDHGWMTPLHWAIKKKNLTIVLLLIKHGADVDAKDILGRTPLYLAIQANDSMCVKALLFFKASPLDKPVNTTWSELCGDHPVIMTALQRAASIHLEANLSSKDHFPHKWFTLVATNFADFVSHVESDPSNPFYQDKLLWHVR